MRYLPLFLLLTLSSCVTLSKAKDKLRDNPAELAELCATEFPAKPPVYIEGKRDTVVEVRAYVDTLTVECPPNLPETTYVKVPGATQVKTITVSRVDTIEVDSYVYERASMSERLKASEASLAAVTASYSELKDRVRGKVLIPRWWLLILGLALAGWAYWRIKAGALNKVISKLK